MGLLSECKFCHQFFSTAGMADHVRWNHGMKALESSGLAKFRAHDKPATLKRAPEPPAQTAPTQSRVQPSGAKRPTKAELAQKVRSELQARKNEATAAFIRTSAQQKANSEPLSTVWKEQVAKLSPLKGAVRLSTKARREAHSYSLQLGRVPARSVPVAAAPSPPPAELSSRNAAKQRPSQTVDVPCSCGGDNERCYRCDGRGYYEVSAARAARLAPPAAASPATRQAPASFASDTRGGIYGLREQGRFASAPSHDDFGDDSSS